MSAVKYKAQEKNVNLRVRLNPNIPVAVLSDPSRLKQILLNLLSNSLKFTHEGHIDVYAKVSEAAGRKVKVRFAVSDTGIGIAENKQATIFESFSQAETHTFRKYGGTGLGLSICKKLTELLGGEIGVKSIEGIGSTFWFEIPMEISETQLVEEPRKGKASGEGLSGLKVLMVEDDKMNQFVLTKILKRWDVEVEVAGNGQEAVDKLQTNNYQVVLMDLHMPVMDGYEATRSIRSGNAGVLNPMVPIIALTGDINKETQTLVRQAGMNAFISKPCEQQALIQILMTYGNRDIQKPVIGTQAVTGTGDRRRTKNQIKQALWDIFDDDIDATRSMIRHFIKQVPENVEQAKTFLKENQQEHACKSLHKVKPGFSYLGFPEVSDMVEKLQQYIRNNEKSEIVSHNIINLEKEIKKIVSMLHEVHKELEPNE